MLADLRRRGITTVYSLGDVAGKGPRGSECVRLSRLGRWLESVPFSLDLQFVRVPYDIEAEIAVAASVGIPALQAYAIEVRTAVYRGRHEDLGLLGGSAPGPAGSRWESP